MTKKRTGGARWRLLVHEFGEKGSKMMGRARSVMSHPPRRLKKHAANTPERLRETIEVYPDTEFDELVVGQWIHIEQMDDNLWWMNIGGVTVDVRTDREGRPKQITVFGPYDYDQPREGCDYNLHWTDQA